MACRVVENVNFPQRNALIKGFGGCVCSIFIKVSIIFIW